MGRGESGGDESWEIMPGDDPDERPSFVLNETGIELPDPSVVVRLNAGGRTFSMGRTYTSGLNENGALIFAPTMREPSISASWLIWPRTAMMPWNAIFLAARYVQT